MALSIRGKYDVRFAFNDSIVLGEFIEGLAKTSLDKSLYLQFISSYTEWVDSLNKKLNLGFKPGWHLLDHETSSLLLDAVRALPDEELESLGISKIVEKDVPESEINKFQHPAIWEKAGSNTTGFYDKVTWYQGLDTN